MKTLNVIQAAELLHMSPASLREKAKLGLIKAAKPGKRWVFLEEHLAEYLQSLYPAERQAPLSGCEQEATLCHYTNAGTSSGQTSPHQVESEYADLLGLETES